MDFFSVGLFLLYYWRRFWGNNNENFGAKLRRGKWWGNFDENFADVTHVCLEFLPVTLKKVVEVDEVWLNWQQRDSVRLRATSKRPTYLYIYVHCFSKCKGEAFRNSIWFTGWFWSAGHGLCRSAPVVSISNQKIHCIRILPSVCLVWTWIHWCSHWWHLRVVNSNRWLQLGLKVFPKGKIRIFTFELTWVKSSIFESRGKCLQ